MPQGNPKSGEFYLHFKNKLYQVMTVAKHSETGEELVVYQALYGDFGVYARPLDMFISEVDREVYPEVAQKYRFQLTAPMDIERDTEAEKEQWEAGENMSGEQEQWKAVGNMSGEQEQWEAGENMSGEKEQLEAGGNKQAQPSDAQKKQSEKKDITELLMDFYDAETFEKKYEILTAMQKDITDVLIDNMAVVLDVVIPEGDLYKRYDELRTCLKTRQRYEVRRN